MALDNFRRIDIILDNINNKLDLPYKLKASMGDWNGRMLFVQVTNNGIIEEQKANLHLGFRHTENEKITGLYQFEVENAEEGIYKIAYPREMLELAGVVVCGIRIIDSGDNIICATEDFSVEVMRSVFSGEMEVAENSIRVFDKMILDINAHERRVSVMELNFKELAAMLTMNIPHMDVPVSSRQADWGATKETCDRIDAKITSRAPAYSALSNAVWTDKLALLLARQYYDYSTKQSSGRWLGGWRSGDWYTITSVSGPGYLKDIYADSNDNGARLRLTIDGEVMVNARTGRLNVNQTADSDGERMGEHTSYRNTSKIHIVIPERFYFAKGFKLEGCWDPSGDWGKPEPVPGSSYNGSSGSDSGTYRVNYAVQVDK